MVAAGPSFQWNILNYGRITNNVRVQDARFQELLLTYQNTVLTAQKEVEDSLAGFLRYQENAASLAQSASAAKRSLDLAFIQYKQGSTDFTTVLTAQQSLLTAQDSLASSIGNIALNLVGVYRAIGGGWEIRQGEDILPPKIKEMMARRTDWDSLLSPVNYMPSPGSDPIFAVRTGKDLLNPEKHPSGEIMISVFHSIRLRKVPVGCRDASPSLPAPRFLLLASCFLILLFPAGCNQEKQSAKPPSPPKVTVSQPTQENIVDYLEFSGNTQAVNTVQLRARVEGYLDGVYFKDGDIVKKDQLLFLIQQNTYFAQLQQAEGSVQNQKALLEHAKTEFARFSKLFEQKAAADTDVENWRNQRDTAQAGLLSAEAQRDLAKLNLGYTWVVAPFTGRIDRRLVDPGNLVGSAGSSTVLAELTQIDPLYLYFNIAETVTPPYILDARACVAQVLKLKTERSKTSCFHEPDQ